jgi:hypothetical protein
MSNRRRIKNPSPQNPVTAWLASLDGAHIPGGCDHCDAYQVIHANRHGANLHQIDVRHDDDCPWLAARQAQP